MMIIIGRKKDKKGKCDDFLLSLSLSPVVVWSCTSGVVIDWKVKPFPISATASIDSILIRFDKLPARCLSLSPPPGVARCRRLPWKRLELIIFIHWFYFTRWKKSNTETSGKCRRMSENVRKWNTRAEMWPIFSTSLSIIFEMSISTCNWAINWQRNVWKMSCFAGAAFNISDHFVTAVAADWIWLNGSPFWPVATVWRAKKRQKCFAGFFFSSLTLGSIDSI